MKVALVHDYLNQYGGAERVLEVLAALYPKAPIYTLLYDEARTHGRFRHRRVITSGLQKFPGAKKHHRRVVWLMPAAVEQFDLTEFDIVISDSASFAKGVITRPGTLHVCYCHTPLRYAWTDHARWRQDFKKSPARPLIPIFQNYLRLWDFAAAQRVDAFVANSNAVAGRIRRYYGRPAQVIYPPVDIEKFRPAKLHSARSPIPATRQYYLVVSRLLPYKSVELAVRAFNDNGERLIIVGDGPERSHLSKLAQSNIEFAGGQLPPALPKFYQNARALIFPQEEDFGLVAVEALAAGTPVIGYNAGGLKEIITSLEHGVLFDQQTPKALNAALASLKYKVFNKEALFAQAQQFSTERFSLAFSKFVNDQWGERQGFKESPVSDFTYFDHILD